MIAIEDLYFTYHNSDFQLQIPKLTIESGEKVAIIGPSGFGKTTLLNVMVGILTPNRGTVKINEQQVNALKDAERRAFRISTVGFVFQDFKLLEYLRVRDNILLPFRINKQLKLSPEVQERVGTIADLLDIGDKLNRFPAKLSQGEQQRVAIGRALINQPSIIFADEPTGNLDPVNKDRIKQVLFDSATQFNATLITVTHDHELLKGFDRIIDFQEFQNVSRG